MAGWHHWCNEHELGQTLGDGEGQGGLVCCSPWGHKELDVTGRLTKKKKKFIFFTVEVSHMFSQVCPKYFMTFVLFLKAIFNFNFRLFIGNK